MDNMGQPQQDYLRNNKRDDGATLSRRMTRQHYLMGRQDDIT